MWKKKKLIGVCLHLDLAGPSGVGPEWPVVTLQRLPALSYRKAALAVFFPSIATFQPKSKLSNLKLHCTGPLRPGRQLTQWIIFHVLPSQMSDP